MTSKSKRAKNDTASSFLVSFCVAVVVLFFVVVVSRATQRLSKILQPLVAQTDQTDQVENRPFLCAPIKSQDGRSAHGAGMM